MSTTESSPVPSTTPKTTNFEVGQNLAECYVLTQLAIQSPTGDVWLAEDEVLGRDVSLRLVPDAVRNHQPFLQELRQEIKRNRQLIHPQILRTYDLVEEPEWAAISMDSFEAEPVSALLKKQPEGRFKVADLRPVVTQLIQAIEDAHRINFLHRDLSPANLLLDKEGKLLVANFGISDVIRRSLSKADAPGFGNGLVSPQIAEGKEATKSDDVYGLGAVLFALTTGAAPSAGLDILKKEALGIPVAWQQTIAACLSKDPKARPESASEVGKQLAAESASPAASPAVAAAAVVGAGVAAAAVEKTKTALEQPKARFESAATPGEEAKSPLEPAKASADVKPNDDDDSEIVPKKSILKKEPEVAKDSAVKDPAAKEPVLELVKDVPQKKVPAKKPVEAKAMPMPYSGYESTGSRFPVAAIAGAAALVVVGAIVLHFTKSKPADAPAGNSEPQTAELNVVNNATPPPVVNDPISTVPAKPEAKDPVESVKPDEVTPKVAVAPPPVDVPVSSKVTDQDPEKAHAELLQKKQQAEASVADTQKLIDEKTKATAALKKSLADSAPQKKKIEADQKAAVTAAEEAQKVAAEKARLAEEAKKAATDFGKKSEEAVAAQQAAEAELQVLQKSLADKQREAEAAAKTAADLEKVGQERAAAMKKSEEEAAKAKLAAADAEKAALEAQKKKAADDEKNAAKAAIAEQMEALKQKLADLEKQASGKTVPPPAPATPAPLVKAATPAPPIPVPPVPTGIKGQKSTPAPVPPAPLPQAGPAGVNFPPPDAANPTLANLVPPTASPSVTSTAGGLGLKFVPVGDVEFCIWPTRVKDFEQFAKAVNLKSNSWKNPGFKQGLDHPVVNVTWNESVAFCKWLTEKEHKEGTLPANQFYRLPTDLEWSRAAGLPAENGSTPEARDMGVPGVYPWGTAWPPPQGAGNYTGEETGSDVAIRGYDDGFAWTSPAGTFPANALGLYDMGGNVWQWCMDNWNNESKAKVLRGASWYNGALKLSLLTSCRVSAGPDSLTDNYGFRIVRATEAAKSGKK